MCLFVLVIIYLAGEQSQTILSCVAINSQPPSESNNLSVDDLICEGLRLALFQLAMWLLKN